MNQGTCWKTLCQAFEEAISEKSVTHALFTTYQFNPLFFETTVIPLMLNIEEGLSEHTGFRRLQVEELLKENPLEMAVFFDGSTELQSFPWLSYQAIPVNQGSAFHGKVIILRLQNDNNQVQWILGAGSANLTQAGWWENIEGFNFTPPFDPRMPPSSLLAGLHDLLSFLDTQIHVGNDNVVSFLKSELGISGGPTKSELGWFGAFIPGKTRFVEWLRNHLPTRKTKAEYLEFISPYFPTGNYEGVLSNLLETTKSERIRLWLPEDRQQTVKGNGKAVRMDQDAYEELNNVKQNDKKLVTWCQFADKQLIEEATPGDPENKPSRFLHAKIIRLPGSSVFVGSVNFSNNAFYNNFEAGFLLPDSGAPWLTPIIGEEPSCFLEPDADHRPHLGIPVDLPQFSVLYHWGDKTISVVLLNPDAFGAAFSRFHLVNSAGKDIVELRLASANSCKLVDSRVVELLETSLRSNPKLRIRSQKYPELIAVWVQQDGLEFRPLPVDITLDVWKVFEIWRFLAPGERSVSRSKWDIIRPVITKQLDPQEDEPVLPCENPKDIFEEMASIHSSFHLLRTRLLNARDSKTITYYLTAERPDTIEALLKQLEEAGDNLSSETLNLDAVERWVVLHWLKQIARDQKGHPAAKNLARRADVLLANLYADDAMKELVDDKEWLAWVSNCFLAPVVRTDGADKIGTTK